MTQDKLILSILRSTGAIVITSADASTPLHIWLGPPVHFNHLTRTTQLSQPPPHTQPQNPPSDMRGPKSLAPNRNPPGQSCHLPHLPMVLQRTKPKQGICIRITVRNAGEIGKEPPSLPRPHRIFITYPHIYPCDARSQTTILTNYLGT